MTTDLILAILHHLLIFSIAGIIAVELAMIRHGLKAEALGMLGRIDGAYGLLALLVVIVGAARVFYGLRGWEYYIFYWAFWAKMAAFVVVGLLSIPPTMRIIRWRRAAAGVNAFIVPEDDIGSARIYLKAEALVFLLIPTFAAIMARGVGY